MSKYFVAVVAAVLGSVAWAHADEQVGETAKVQGVVHFEMRHTIVPLYCDTEMPCPQSQPYWAIVLNNSGTQYELDQRFDTGESRSPESVTLDGISVHPGIVLRVEATVEFSSADYYILNDFRNVGVVMDYDDSLPGEASLFPLPNWNCRGNPDGGTEIDVAVWYTGFTGMVPTDRYGIRLFSVESTSSGAHIHPMASLSGASAEKVGDDLVYEAQSLQGTVELTVAEPSDETERDVMSRLKFSLIRPVIPLLPQLDDERVPSQSEMDVVCNRIR